MQPPALERQQRVGSRLPEPLTFRGHAQHKRCTLIAARAALQLMQHRLCRQRVCWHRELRLRLQQQQLTAACAPAQLRPPCGVDHRTTAPLRAAIRHLHAHSLPAAL